MNCLRCNTPMKDDGRRDIQLGRHSFLFGDIDNLLSGSLEVKIYICPNCKKIELFESDAEETLSERIRRENNTEDR